MTERPARSLPRWPRANRRETIDQRQQQLRALSHWSPTHHQVLSWPVPPEVLGSFQECLTGHLVLPVGVVGPLGINLGDYTLDNAGNVQEKGRGELLARRINDK